MACWITKATNTHLEYVILIAFPWKQRLHEGDSLIRRVYVARLVAWFCLWAGVWDIAHQLQSDVWVTERLPLLVTFPVMLG